MSLVGLMGLMGCSSEQDGPEQSGERSVPVQVVSYMAPYEDYGAVSRSGEDVWTPPTGYTEPEEKASIGVFFTQDAATCEARRFGYMNDKWYMFDEEVASGNYQLYGYLHNHEATASIAPNSTYADGAVLTLGNLGTISGKDVCVMVGAKEGTDAITPATPGLKRGQFGVSMTAGEDAHNYLFLLFEHLYAAISFRFHLDAAYAGIRTIKLTQLELRGYTAFDDEVQTPMPKTKNATVSLKANSSEDSPIEEITFTEETGSSGYVTFFSGEEENIPSENDIYTSEKMGYVMPEMSNIIYVLRTTYDVYDTNGNRIRQNCKAENKIDPYNLFNKITKLDRGKKYTVNLTVKPTYLYVLSDPDLDNPQVELE